jgi:hypothetical protein
LADLRDRPAGADIGVARVLALGDPGDGQALRQLGRQVLGGVDGEVDLPIEERALDLGHEARLVAARAGLAGGLAALVARGGDGHDLGAPEGVGDLFGLDQGQGAPPGAEPQRRLTAGHRSAQRSPARRR